MAEILGLVDEEYITRMTGFEADCNNGKGDPMACHQVGEFFSLVKNDRERAGTVFEKNCTSQKYSASCFNLAKLYLTGKGVVQSDANNQCEASIHPGADASEVIQSYFEARPRSNSKDTFQCAEGEKADKLIAFFNMGIIKQCNQAVLALCEENSLT